MFISSAMADTAAERRAVAEALVAEGAQPVWFEEFGGDANAEEAHLTEVDFSTIYVGIASKQYGRPNPPHGDSATEIEYLRARETGKRVAFYVAQDSAAREWHLSRFIERVRFHTSRVRHARIIVLRESPSAVDGDGDHAGVRRTARSGRAGRVEGQ